MGFVSWLLGLVFIHLASAVRAHINSDQQHYNALISSAIFEGLNTADPKANVTSLFKDPKNHADAVASILIYNAKSTSFDPSEKIHTHPEIYFDFLQTVASFPAFHHQGTTEDKEYELYLNGDPEQLLDQIADHYYDYDYDQCDDYDYNSSGHRDCGGRSGGDDRNGIKKRREKTRQAFRGMIPKTVENEEWKQWLLSLITIRKPANSDEVTFELAQVRLTISRSNNCNNKELGPSFNCNGGGGGVAIDRQVALMVKSSYSVNGGFISFFSDDISRFVEKGTLDEFLTLMTTRQITNADIHGEKEGEFSRDQIRKQTGSQHVFRS
ncbi:hypothetical protein BGZ49_009669 [Haplosporangium sp. Z 27]|nr:hypothetical protein BGZ49_009669 [Haplosporangium sp. Z 27]